jgi:phage gp36-like protein
MSYTTIESIKSHIPVELLIQALDDDGDKVADAGLLEQIVADASTAVDALLGGSFETPFTDPPAAVRDAASIFACELIYERRPTGAKNPFTARADQWRAGLRKIAAGETALTNENTGFQIPATRRRLRTLGRRDQNGL